MNGVEALAEQQDELRALLDGASEDDWARPSPCEGWTMGDVVLHLAQTNEMAVASATGRFAEVLTSLAPPSSSAVASIDGAVDAMVARERGAPIAELHERWRRSAADLQAALSACEPSDRVPWVAGEVSARTLATTRLAETWIHTGDVAGALGTPLAPTDRIHDIARLAWRTLPYAFSRAGRTLAGPVAFELRSPSGATWRFAPDDADPVTTIGGDALELCLVAGRRLEPTATGLTGDGPDADAVLELVRTYA